MTESNRTQLFLNGIQNRTFGPYLVALHLIHQCRATLPRIENWRTWRPQLSDTERMTPGLPAGVLRAMTEAKVSQVRAAALDALSKVLGAAGGGCDLRPDVRHAIAAQLGEIKTSDSSASVKARAAAVEAEMQSACSST
jgi:hypothetical protein